MLSKNLFNQYYIFKKSNNIISNKNFYQKLIKYSNAFNYFNLVKLKLNSLNNPYRLTFKNYILIKYFLSFFIFLIILIRYNNYTVAIFYFIILFFIPNLFIYIYTKKENIKLICDIDTINQILIMSLTSKLSLESSFILALQSIKNQRFKTSFKIFIDEYIYFNYNLKIPTYNLTTKFNSSEVLKWFSILLQDRENIGLVNSLEVYSSELENTNYSHIKYKMATSILGISLASILAIINILLIVLYPMFYQITNEINLMFM